MLSHIIGTNLKFHKYQTKEMLEAIKVFDKWLENH